MAIPTYVINLDRHADRFAHMRRELANVAFERFPAVDGATIAEGNKSLTRFELACLASHQKIWRKLLGSAEPYACVLEDDLHLSPSFGALLADSGWVPPDAHSIKLDTYFQTVLLGERHPARGALGTARLYSRHQSSAAYVVTRAGAKRYLELSAEPSLPADYALFPRNPRALGLVIYQLTPAVALQDHLRADEAEGPTFATAMGGPKQRPRLSAAARIKREGARLLSQIADLGEATYLKGVLGAKATIVGTE